MNLEEKKNLVKQLHQDGKNRREIALAHMSVRDISKIIRKLEGISEEKSVKTQALDLFYQDKKPIEVTVELDLKSSNVIRLSKDYLKLEGFHKSVLLYEEINDNLSLFLKLYYAII